MYMLNGKKIILIILLLISNICFAGGKLYLTELHLTEGNAFNHYVAIFDLESKTPLAAPEKTVDIKEIDENIWPRTMMGDNFGNSFLYFQGLSGGEGLLHGINGEIGESSLTVLTPKILVDGKIQNFDDREGIFATPLRLAVFNNSLYIMGIYNGKTRIYKYPIPKMDGNNRDIISEDEIKIDYPSEITYDGAEDGICFDDSGNLYVSYYDVYGDIIAKYAPGESTPSQKYHLTKQNVLSLVSVGDRVYAYTEFFTDAQRKSLGITNYGDFIKHRENVRAYRMNDLVYVVTSLNPDGTTENINFKGTNKIKDIAVDMQHNRVFVFDFGGVPLNRLLMYALDKPDLDPDIYNIDLMWAEAVPKLSVSQQ